MNENPALAGSTPPAPAFFTVLRGNRREQFPYERVFAIGYALWRAKKYERAAQVFEHLATATDRGPRAHILLAHCRAMQGDYAGCCGLLNQVLAETQYGNAASQLHDAFVMWRVGFFVEAKQAIEKLVEERPELPTLCLMLADLLSQAGNARQPRILLKLAIERDGAGGAVAQVARHELSMALASAALRGL